MSGVFLGTRHFQVKRLAHVSHRLKPLATKSTTVVSGSNRTCVFRRHVKTDSTSVSANERKVSKGTIDTANRATTTTTTSTTTGQAPLTMVVPQSFSIGTLAGFAGSLAGMGGGFVMVPLLSVAPALKLTQHMAHGTSLFAVCATGLAGAAGYGLSDVYLDSAAALSFAGMLSARAGAMATFKFSGRALKMAFGAFLFVVAPVVPLKTYFVNKSERHDSETKEDAVAAAAVADAADDDDDESNKSFISLERIIIPAVAGLGAGFFSGLFGIGGGVVTVPALTIATDMNHHQALGTSLCAMALPAMVGTITHIQNNNIALRVAFPLACGAFTGGYIGGNCGSKIPEDKLRWGFSALLLTLGTKHLLQVARMAK